jgi:glycosyltransferase involved in cell wall biosynthesis
MTTPYITALIDTYNYGCFIEEAIESVLHQDYPRERVQILVVDDGSTDDTAERVKKFGSVVQYFQKQNGGQGSAFNFGVERAAGEIIALLDADDYWLPGKLKRISEQFSMDRAIGLVYHALREQDETLKVERDLPFVAVSGHLPDDTVNLLSYRVYPTSSLAFRSNVLRKIMPVPKQIRLQADLYLTLLVPFISPIYAIPEPLGIYRIHGKNFYTQRPGMQMINRKRGNISLRREIIGLVEQWLKTNTTNLNTKNVQLFFEQLYIFVATDEFELEPPDRLTFFRHLLRCNKVYGAGNTWKLRMLNRLNAVIALLTGYGTFSRIVTYENRLRQRMMGDKGWGSA